jgi:hypothetical protein
MWARRVRLMKPIRPRSSWSCRARRTGDEDETTLRLGERADRLGRWSSSNVRSSGLTQRIASPTVSDSRRTFTRNRPTPSSV